MSARALVSLLLLLPGSAAANTLAGRDCQGGNIVCDGSTVCGGAETCSNGTFLQGVFTNVGLFSVGVGTTVFTSSDVQLQIFAATVTITGTISAAGRGKTGGFGGDITGANGSNGEGDGPGNGAAGGPPGRGGGGAAYGGSGGDGGGAGSGFGTAGATYGDSSLPISTGSVTMGSGGGGGGNTAIGVSANGGRGGGSIYIEASSFTMTGGTITVQGQQGISTFWPGGGGGGGSGGGLLLRVPGTITLNGFLLASGGMGGTVSAFSPDTSYPGGGGGGGRVKLFYRNAAFSVSVSTAGGGRGFALGSAIDGTPAAVAGSSGTQSYGTIPDAPVIAAPQVFATSVAWNWSATADWGSAADTSRRYRVYSDTVTFRNPARSPQLAVSSSVLQGVETGLTPNTTYTRFVTAYTDHLDSLASASVTTVTLAAQPSVSLPALSLLASGLSATWSANGNPADTVYATEVSTRSDFTPFASSASLTAVATSFTGLSANTNFFGRVTAYNRTGVATQPASLGSKVTYAAAPSVVSSTSPGTVGVSTFAFTNSVSTGAGGLAFYRYVFDTNAAHSWTDSETSWSGLGVLATTATGNGSWYLHLHSYNSDSIGFHSLDIGPFQLSLTSVIPPGQPAPVSGAFTAASAITWSWPPASSFGASISTYVVSVGTSPASFSIVVASAIGPSNSFTLDPATNGFTYYLKVFAIDSGGVSSGDSPGSSPGVLVDRSPPPALAAPTPDKSFSYDGKILYSWTAASDAESGIMEYFLDIGTTPGGSDVLSQNVGMATSYQASGLPTGKTYFASVRARNNAGILSGASPASPGVPVFVLNQIPQITKPYNWPNPFDPRAGPTQIGFSLDGPASVTLKLFTLEGDLVFEESRDYSSGGTKVWPWSGKNGSGRTVAPGGYRCVIEKSYGGRTEKQKFKVAVLY